MYAEVSSPVPVSGCGSEVPEGIPRSSLELEEAHPSQNARVVERMSDTGSRVRHGSVVGKALGRMYEPSLKERVQVLLAGRFGWYVELTNLVLSMLMFGFYVAELYAQSTRVSSAMHWFEMTVTLLFITDMVLHLIAASSPWRYLISPMGLIDLVTIVPSLIVFFSPQNRSQFMFALRVLRIFRALRVLRLRTFLRMRKRGFDYELGVFILSSIAVLLCAAGMYHALEEASYNSSGVSFSFHKSLYFILVTVSTIGYGDITPQTTMGRVFVMVLIIGIFTVVPREVNKLNQLAKQNNDYDKDYFSKNNASGHVIVSRHHLSDVSVLDFLHEFYHSSRGNIHLDVVFLCDVAPSRRLSRLLATEKYRQRVYYLRGRLTDRRDQLRVKLNTATAVFLLSQNSYQLDFAQQDVTPILETLSARNFCDSIGHHIGIYVQLCSRDEDSEMTSSLLGASSIQTSVLQNMIIARGAVCPGASTLILNLVHSMELSEYKVKSDLRKLWVDEYLHGINHQIFPVIFSKRFEEEAYEDVVRNLFERYGVLLIGVHSPRLRPAFQGAKPAISLAPFHSYLKEGDVGFVIAKTAAVMLQAMKSYGGWSNDTPLKKQQRKTTTSVRVSSDTLLRRMSPRSRFRLNGRGPAIPERLTSNSSEDESASKCPQINLETEDLKSYSDGKDELDPLMIALKSNDLQSAQLIIDRDNSPSQLTKFTDHCIICAESVSDALSLLVLLRRFDQNGAKQALSSVNTHLDGSSHRLTVLLLQEVPSSKDLANCLDGVDHNGLSFHRVYFVAGRSSRCKDLNKVAAYQAWRILILPSQGIGLNSSCQTVERGDFDDIYDATEFNEDQNATEENIADFGAIRSLLAIEMNHQLYQQQLPQPGKELNQPKSPRQAPRGTRVLSSNDTRQPETTYASLYQREVEHGLPLESVRLRVLERFPDLNPSIFREHKSAIEVALNDVSAQQNADPISTSCDNAIAVLHYARSARFCRPTDPAVCHDDYPLLAPAFACGHIIISSLLDRVLCQAFYNPYITDVVKSLACGSFCHQNSSASTKGVRDQGTFDPVGNGFSQLIRMPLEASHIGMSFLDVFLDLLPKKIMAIALWRAPSPNLENLQPYVYTCPTPDTILHTNDELFVLG